MEEGFILKRIEPILTLVSARTHRDQFDFIVVMFQGGANSSQHGLDASQQPDTSAANQRSVKVVADGKIYSYDYEW